MKSKLGRIKHRDLSKLLVCKRIKIADVQKMEVIIQGIKSFRMLVTDKRSKTRADTTEGVSWRKMWIASERSDRTVVSGIAYWTKMLNRQKNGCDCDQSNEFCSDITWVLIVKPAIMNSDRPFTTTKNYLYLFYSILS